MQVPIGISNRHIHLSQEDADVLFGKKYTFTNIKNLSQPGQYACKETLTLAGQKGEIENIRVLGPRRTQTQVEILRSDCYKLWITAPIRISGDLQNSANGRLIGPKWEISIKEGIIIAQRHLHLSPRQAETLRISQNQNIQIQIEGKRKLIFQNVKVRIHENFYIDFHIDQDEANAAGITPEMTWEILSDN